MSTTMKSMSSLQDAEALDEMVSALELTGDYRVLRRLIPREPSATPEGEISKTGVILDVETTGLDPARDEVIELAMIKFRYSERDEVAGVSDIFQSLNEPTSPIPPAITEITGITDAMVAGHKIDAAAVDAFVTDANIVIAHNAKFDRPFVEKVWPIFAQRHWACSLAEVDWLKYGFGGAKLLYLLADIGYFHDAHRAVDDCQALLKILSHPLPGTSPTALATLLDQARRKTFRIWVKNSPYDLKDKLKARGYRWNDGSDGRPKAWYGDVDENKRDAELQWLKTEIFQRDLDLTCSEITALDRYSPRV
jgi:DNA polymerase III subunit epsilon